MAFKQIFVLGTKARGGIQSVIDAYKAEGFYSAGRAHYVSTHDEGTLLYRIQIALFAYTKVAYCLARNNVELLHLHMSMRGSFWRKAVFLLMGKLRSVQTIIHLHGSEFEVFYTKSNFFTRWLVRFIFNQASSIVVLSPYWQQFVCQISDTKVEVIGNFVSDRYDSSVVNRDPAAFLFLGKFGQRKGIYDLVQAFVTVRHIEPSAVLYCGGNGDVSTLRRTVLELQLEDSVKILGWVTGIDKLKLLQRCSIFVLPSYNEGLPVAILEAMSFSMAVVSTNVGAIPDLIDDNNGMVVIPGDQKALAKAMLKVLKQNCNNKFGAASRHRYLKKYSPEIALTKMRYLYRSLGIEL